MSPSEPCSAVRELLPEVALGTATGDERARALQHLARCPLCRKVLNELTDVADELLLLVPAREPPVGFESRVVEELFGEGRRPRRWPRLVAAAAAVVALMAASAGVVLVATGDDRELAAQVRATLATANGEYFSAAELRSASGGDVGTVFSYEGDPSWIFVVCNGCRSRMFRIAVAEESGRWWRVGEMSVAHGTGTWGAETPVDVHDLVAVTLRGEGGKVLQAHL
jgi:hypothetical protein